MSRGHFEEFLSEADLEDNKALLRTIFEKPTYAYAMMYDYLLQKLKGSVFRDPRLMFSPVRPPFINDPGTARQLSLVSTAAILASQPERDKLAGLLALGNPYDSVLLYFTADLMGLPNPFPAVPVRKLTVTAHFGDVFLTYLPQAR